MSSAIALYICNYFIMPIQLTERREDDHKKEEHFPSCTLNHPAAKHNKDNINCATINNRYTIRDILNLLRIM